MKGRDTAEAAGALIRPGWPLIPFGIAVIGGVLAGATAPEIPTLADLPTWFSPFFTTVAAVVATLFVALALGARQVEVSTQLAGFTILYVALGEVAAVAGLSTGLPTWTYAWLLGIAVGSGIGALSSSVVIGAKAISNEATVANEEEVRRLKRAGTTGGNGT